MTDESTQQALKRTLEARFNTGVPNYRELSDAELCATARDTWDQNILPLWDLVLELVQRLEATAT